MASNVTVYAVEDRYLAGCAEQMKKMLADNNVQDIDIIATHHGLANRGGSTLAYTLVVFARVGSSTDATQKTGSAWRAT